MYSLEKVIEKINDRKKIKNIDKSNILYSNEIVNELKIIRKNSNQHPNFFAERIIQFSEENYNINLFMNKIGNEFDELDNLYEKNLSNNITSSEKLYMEFMFSKEDIEYDIEVDAQSDNPTKTNFFIRLFQIAKSLFLGFIKFIVNIIKSFIDLIKYIFAKIKRSSAKISSWMKSIGKQYKINQREMESMLELPTRSRKYHIHAYETILKYSRLLLNSNVIKIVNTLEINIKTGLSQLKDFIRYGFKVRLAEMFISIKDVLKLLELSMIFDEFREFFPSNPNDYESLTFLNKITIDNMEMKLNEKIYGVKIKPKITQGKIKDFITSGIEDDSNREFLFSSNWEELMKNIANASKQITFKIKFIMNGCKTIASLIDTVNKLVLEHIDNETVQDVRRWTREIQKALSAIVKIVENIRFSITYVSTVGLEYQFDQFKIFRYLVETMMDKKLNSDNYKKTMNTNVDVDEYLINEYQKTYMNKR